MPAAMEASGIPTQTEAGSRFRSALLVGVVEETRVHQSSVSAIAAITAMNWVIPVVRIPSSIETATSATSGAAWRLVTSQVSARGGSLGRSAR